MRALRYKFISVKLTFPPLLIAMFRLPCVLLVFAMPLFVAEGAAIAPGVSSKLYGAIAGASDFELNLRPPEESTKDIEESLDAIMKSEDISDKASQADFAADKEHMIEAEKLAIREIVASALQPVLAKLRAHQ